MNTLVMIHNLLNTNRKWRKQYNLKTNSIIISDTTDYCFRRCNPSVFLQITFSKNMKTQKTVVYYTTYN